MKAERSTLCGHGLWEAVREREREGEREMMKKKELYKVVVSVQQCVRIRVIIVMDLVQ